MIIRRDTDDLANIFIIWLYNPNSWITIHVDILKHFKPLIFFFFPSQNLLIVLRDIEQIILSYFLTLDLLFSGWKTKFRPKFSLFQRCQCWQVRQISKSRHVLIAIFSCSSPKTFKFNCFRCVYFFFKKKKRFFYNCNFLYYF